MAKRQVMKKKSVNFVPAANNRLPGKNTLIPFSTQRCLVVFHCRNDSKIRRTELSVFRKNGGEKNETIAVEYENC